MSKMTPEQVMELMVGAEEARPLPTNEQLLCQWAGVLSNLSGKLTDDELYSLIALGACIYQRGYREFESGITADLLLKSLRQEK
ncbi:hypothetical protein EGT07_18240 [Herbaspirillum sp. HC18]|nr:hypothetical protein EGT07_18240 [Herbaspirillum sp. HC18]